LVLALLAWTSCSTSHGTSAPLEPGSLVSTPIDLGTQAPGSGGHTVVLVALDGVRWREVFHGVERARARSAGMHEPELLDAHALVPNLHALAADGTALSGGSQPGIAASGPNFVSVPGYMELFTGRRWTGCTGNGCGRVKWPTIADEIAALPSVVPNDVAVIASWDGVGRAASRDPSKLTLSVGRTTGETRDRLRIDARASALLDAGERAGPYPGIGDFRSDAATAEIALHYLATHRPRFLFLGLGESDEYGHRNDYRGYLRALAYADGVIGRLARILSELEHDGRATTLIVTTDHGRGKDFQDHGAAYPESARIWLVGAGWGIRRQGLVTPALPRHLADVTATVRALAQLPHPRPGGQTLAELLDPPAIEIAAWR
jgi:hypothetical protein